MRAEDALQIMADFYSDIFPTRRHALNHLLCAIGNGYEWVNGELVETVADEPVSRYTLKEPVVKAVFRFEDMRRERIENEAPARKHLAEILEKQRNAKSVQDARDAMAEYIRCGRGLAFKWYPLSALSRLYHVPKDVKPDWAALVEETKQLLEQDGIDWRKYNK